MSGPIGVSRRSFWWPQGRAVPEAAEIAGVQAVGGLCLDQDLSAEASILTACGMPRDPDARERRRRSRTNASSRRSAGIPCVWAITAPAGRSLCWPIICIRSTAVAISVRTLRRRMHDLGLRWKRPRYVYATKDPQSGAEKRGLVRRIKQMPAEAVLLFTDATILRWFPPLRYTWAFRGEQAQVQITGENAKRVLFAAINPRTGHRRGPASVPPTTGRLPGVLAAPASTLRRSASVAAAGQGLLPPSRRQSTIGRPLKVTLLWLPKQCPELNPQDHLWRELKRLIVANRQYQTIDDEAQKAEHWFLGLPPSTALRKAGILSGDFWLKEFM